MKKELLIIMVCLMITTLVSAGEGNGNKNQNQKQKQQQGQGQAQGQLQGQVGINKAVGAGNETVVNDGDTEVWSPTWASTPSTEGKAESSVYSLWGGINKNELSFDKKVYLYIEVLGNARESGQISQEAYDEGVLMVVKLAGDNIKPDKGFGIIPKVCDNPIFNLITCW